MSKFPLTRFLEHFGIILVTIIIYLAAIAICIGFYKSHRKEQMKAMKKHMDEKPESPYKGSHSDPHLLIIYLLFLGVPALLSPTYHGLKSISAVHQRVVSGTVFIGCLAAILFWIKVNGLIFYAVLEISAALVLAGQTLVGLGDYVSPIQLLTLLTAAYLVVRGLDNLRNGLNDKKLVTQTPAQLKEST